MRRVFFILIILSVIVIILQGCEKNPYNISNEQSEFISMGNIGLYINGGVMLNFEQENCQISYNSDRMEYRVQKDDQSAMFDIIFTTFPNTEVSELHAIISAFNNSSNSTISADFKLVKYIAGKYWFWSSSCKVGFVFSTEIW
mgnify:FL=1|jgi:hypothetical protein